jgi:lipopolysaccharide export system permease protein
VTVFTFSEAGAFQERIEAAEATLRDGYWELTDARVLSPTAPPESYASYLLASNLDQSQVRQTFTPPESVPFWDLDETILRTERAGLDATRYRLQHDVLMARPLLFVAMVFVAASVSLRFFRFGGVSRMVFGGVAAGFLLYVATSLMQDLGGSGLVGPAVAAWFPAVVGSLLGTLALLYQEDG